MKRYSTVEALEHPKIVFLRELEKEVYDLWTKVYNRLSDESSIATLLEQARVRVTALRQLNSHELTCGYQIEPQSLLSSDEFLSNER